MFDINRCEIVLTAEYDKPDVQGTVGLGYVIWSGARYAYRAVRWDERTADKANVVANKAGGMWDFDILANEFDVSDLLEWGFSEIELQIGHLADDLVDGAIGDDEDTSQQQWLVLAECVDEAEQDEVLDLLTVSGHACRVLESLGDR